ncbi:hypothetical protein [Glycomyces rhizosphaerae]|uniref:Uncharacterized protein n=1 Tax=Glycomyces rhizosphaerae TaxID=2054422 RepID=A0ABV7Q154_9ACTN
MATTTILDFGLPANSHSGANQNCRPGVPDYLEQVVYAAAVDPGLPDRARPIDPLDPGPYGSPDWYPDTRTGRHRRGELPDTPCEDISPQPRSDHAHRPSPGPTSVGAERRRPSPVRNDNEPPEPPTRPWRRFWEDDHEDRYDFGKLREDAWNRFLDGSQELHQAHLIATTTFDDRWMLFWATLRAFLFRVLGVDSSESAVEVESPTVQLNTMAAPAPARTRPLLAGTPFQGPHRTNPISPYLNQWERHFDERQAFREAVAL